MANPPLTVIESAGTGMEPPIALGERGRALWNSVRSEYVIAGRGRYRAFGKACAAADRAEALRSD